ncbi:MAG: cold shock domain-containing protein, partial [Deltaproteobacteria bacterium]|nr:cold shock domain-containing protein [Deltaproteobacteria bacterium]
MENGLMRIGVFVDAGYLQQIDTHYREHHPRAAGIRPGGLMALCREQVARRTGRDLGLCRVVHAAAFLSGGQEGLDRALRRDGFVLHDAGGGLRAPEVALAVEAMDRALRGSLDVAVLLVSSTSYLPLVKGLGAAGVAVLIPAFQIQVPDRKAGGVRRQWTSPALLEEASWPLVVSRLVDDAEDGDPLVRSLFTAPARAAESAEPPAAPAAPPSASRPAEDMPTAEPAPPPREPPPPPEDPSPSGILRGRVVDLRERHGFLQEDWNGRRLFFHCSAVDGGAYLELEVGDRIEYERGTDPRNRAAGIRVRKVDPAAEPAPGAEAFSAAEPVPAEETFPDTEPAPAAAPPLLPPAARDDDAVWEERPERPAPAPAESVPAPEEPEIPPSRPVIGSPTEPNLETVRPTDPALEAVVEPVQEEPPPLPEP